MLYMAGQDLRFVVFLMEMFDVDSARLHIVMNNTPKAQMNRKTFMRMRPYAIT